MTPTVEVFPVLPVDTVVVLVGTVMVPVPTFPIVVPVVVALLGTVVPVVPVNVTPLPETKLTTGAKVPNGLVFKLVSIDKAFVPNWLVNDADCCWRVVSAAWIAVLTELKACVVALLNVCVWDDTTPMPVLAVPTVPVLVDPVVLVAVEAALLTAVLIELVPVWTAVVTELTAFDSPVEKATVAARKLLLKALAGIANLELDCSNGVTKFANCLSNVVENWATWLLKEATSPPSFPLTEGFMLDRFIPGAEPVLLSTR